MRIRMLRSLGVALGEALDRVESCVYEVETDEGLSLVSRGLAEELAAATLVSEMLVPPGIAVKTVDAPKKSKPKTEPLG